MANNLPLILPPVVLDLLLWFGPHLRLKALLQPVIVEVLGIVRQTASVEMRPLWEDMETVWAQFLDRFNFASLLSTFPVGIPALMTGQPPVKTPIGDPVILEISSPGQIVLGWLLLTLAGLLLGTLYYSAVARCSARVIHTASTAASSEDNEKLPAFQTSVLFWQAMQVLALVVLLFVAICIVMVPTILISSFLALLSPLLGQALLLLVSFSAVWFFVPLIFTPHAIFLYGQSIFHAMATSARVVRFSLPGTGMFLVAAIILYQGLSILWTIPPDTSWMALVGILGHAFVFTSLLAASFLYFRGGLAYAQSFRRAYLQHS